ncbi:DUF1003 domain-containing protein [Calidifontibacter indicus]|uniref:Putative membrane protein n=1 Tax=Calidifontibacter indicus TaxID=419650 RepID=A0A3D9UR82_9MICO|nr:DUF1003 domain-containing protein [Calidifontibacter indicus]REF31962.1 putative membrane protein [Calidifontibacter indicus]
MSERTDRGERTDRNERREARGSARRDSGRRLDQPREQRKRLLPRPGVDAERFGVLSEQFARFMGTPTFLIYMTVFVALWLAWNTFMPAAAQFDPRALNYTLLTLILSLQASYAAPLILLAQNRQDDRDRVALEQDRSRDERNLADTEFLTREVASLRLALRDTATRDFVRSELRNLLEEMEERGVLATPSEDEPKPRKKKDKQPKPETPRA